MMEFWLFFLSCFWGPQNLLGPSKKTQLLDSWPLGMPQKTRPWAGPHYHFTRLNPKKKGTLQFCLPALLGIHRHPMQKEFFRSTEGFLRAALTGHGHPGPLWKIAKMAFFNPCMEFQIFLGQMSSFDALRKCHLVIFSQKCPKLRPCAF